MQEYYKQIYDNLYTLYDNKHIINKISSTQYQLLKCQFCHSNNTGILYYFKKYIICKFCLNNQKKIRAFKYITTNNCDTCALSNTKCYTYNNELNICQHCYDNHNKFKKLIKPLQRIFADTNIYLYTNCLIKIQYKDLQYNQYCIPNGIHNIIDKYTTFQDYINNVLDLVQLKDASYKIPICTNNIKDEYYIYINLNPNSDTYNVIYVLKNNNLHITKCSLQIYEDLYSKLFTHQLKINEYCLKCKNAKCNIIDHKVKLNIKSIAYHIFYNYR